MKTRLRLLIPLLTILALILLSCAPAPASQTAPPAQEEAAAETGAEEAAESAAESASAGPETINVTLWIEDSETAPCVVSTGVDSFNEQSDTIQVEVVLQVEQWNVTRTALAGGGGPDIVVTPGPSFVFELAQAGQLLPLDEFSDQFQWPEIFVPWALSLGEVDGQLYSLPAELETLILYYNKTLFEEKGWEPPANMDELVALADQINADGVIPFAHGNSEWRPANEWFVGEFLNHVAGPQKVYEALTGQTPWTDPAFIDSIETLNQMQQNGWFMGGLDRYYTATFDEFRSALGNGDAAMNIEGTWFLSVINDFFGEAAGNSNDWGWIPVPSSTGDAIYDIGMGSTWSINRNAANPQAAAEFLTHFFSPEIQGQLLSNCNYAPGPVRLREDALQDVDPRVADIFSSLAEASDANNYGYTTWTFWPPKSDVYIYEEIEQVWAGNITSEEYLQGLQDIFTEEFEAGEIPPIPER